MIDRYPSPSSRNGHPNCNVKKSLFAVAAMTITTRTMATTVQCCNRKDELVDTAAYFQSKSHTFFLAKKNYTEAGEKLMTRSKQIEIQKNTSIFQRTSDAYGSVLSPTSVSDDIAPERAPQLKSRNHLDKLHNLS